ncbi:MFS transporter [Amycolatopsis lurida]|uniref:Major facilitator transporter n=1 Tax=Amycolatopsis lurida NRRL 2430 TaxID=1460371 RepID=A0A2P2FGG1_AMYLU|nr:MFS transporter [Amycolatopsis lurida]KFU75820.1 major facilitator transporter [Amycolatopsis lurida NRRL 2430]
MTDLEGAQFRGGLSDLRRGRHRSLFVRDHAAPIMFDNAKPDQESTVGETSITPTTSSRTRHAGWSRLLVGRTAILLLVNIMVDTVITAPIIVLPKMLDHFGTDEPAWLNSSAMLAGAIGSPLLGRIADRHGKRRILVLTLVIAAVGALVCLLAPTLWVFVAGRMIQGAAVASLFLTVGIVKDICEPRLGMVVTGVVTTGNAVFGIGTTFLFDYLGDAYGYQLVFVVAGCLAVVTAVLVRFLLPESSQLTPSRIDVRGALLLGGGLALTVAYLSFGSEYGWGSALPLLLAGLAALGVWYVLSRRIPEPVVDLHDRGRPLILTLLVVVLGTGAYQSMLQLFSLLSDVSPDQGLGYGLAGGGGAAIGLLLGLPSLGIVLGGTLSGAISARTGPAPTMAAGVALGTVATLGLFAGVDSLPIAVVCSFLLSLTAGTLVTSGFNMAGVLAPPERQATVSSQVMVMVAIGSVFLNFVGAAVLKSHQVIVDGASLNSARGVFTYIGIGLAAFVLAGVLAVLLVRAQRVPADGRRSVQRR